MNDAMRLSDAKHRAERVTDREIEIVNRLVIVPNFVKHTCNFQRR